MEQKVQKIICESCGSNDLTYVDGFLICKSCGTKHHVIGVETSVNINNLYTLARRAFKERNYKDSKEYYDRIMLNNPDDVEANIYSRLSTMCIFDKNNVCDNIQTFTNSYPYLVKMFNNIDDEKQQLQTVKDFNAELRNVSDFIFNKANDYQYFGEDSIKSLETYDEVIKIQYYATRILTDWNNISREEIDADIDLDVFMANYKQIVTQLKSCSSYDSTVIEKAMNKILDFIHESEPEWKIPEKSWF